MGFIRTFSCIIFAFFTLSSCSIIVRSILGVDIKPNLQPNEKVKKQAKRWGIEREQLYFFRFEGLANYKDYRYQIAENQKTPIEQAKSTDSLALQKIKKSKYDDLQPTQIRMFDDQGTPLYKMVNCYIDPAIPMNWNKYGSFDEFPLKPLTAMEGHYHDSLGAFLPYIYSESKDTITLKDLPPADYFITVFWNDFYVRPSRKLVKKVRRYVDKQHNDKNIVVLFVSNHNAYLWSILNKEKRALVRERLEEKDVSIP
jgi:hypothetical protein